MLINFENPGGGKKSDEQQCVFGAFKNPLERIVDRIAKDHVQGNAPFSCYELQWITRDFFFIINLFLKAPITQLQNWD